MPISSDNRRIAKNTLALYVRMAVMMAVSLFTSRVVLQTLGVEDFGIYNVVGGVVVLFSFLNAAMSSATQRFLNFELGRNDIVQAGRVFSMSVNVHFVIAGTVFLLAETVGLWFLNTQLNIPAARMEAANWVYQFSVFSTLLGIMLVPYNATIIAHERMGFYAWASVGNAILRLLIVYMLYIGDFDKLILYAILTFAVGVIMQIVNVAYCKKAFPQVAVYRPFRDKKLFKELVSFSGWNLFGGISYLGNTQGLNMVMNIFCGVAVNAAMGIANQVVAAVQQFSSNFQVAFNPQIVKKFAAGEREATSLLVFRASRISFALVLFFVAPIFSNVDFILSFWLGIVPAHAASFVRLMLLYCLTEALSAPLFTLVSASGKIREYQVIIGSMFLANVPVAVLILWLGFAPEWVIASRLGITLLMVPVRMWTARKNAALHFRDYTKNVLLRVAALGIFAFVPTFFCARLFSPLVGFLVSGTLSVILVCAGTWIFCFSRDERKHLKKLIREKIGNKILRTIKRVFLGGSAILFVAGTTFVVVKIQSLPEPCTSPNKCVHVSIDDCREALISLTDAGMQSIYDVPFFAQLKTWHDAYGAKFTCYVYGTLAEDSDGNAKITLADIPKKFRQEFEAASDWLKFGFHAEFTKIGKTKSLTGTQFAEKFSRANAAIDAFAGTQARTQNLRLDYFFAKEEWMPAICSAGTQILFAPDTDGRRAYALNDAQSASIRRAGKLAFNAAKTPNTAGGGGYLRTDARYEKMLLPWWTLATLRDRERIVIFTHEWTMDFKVRFMMENSFRWFKNNNYQFTFLENYNYEN